MDDLGTIFSLSNLPGHISYLLIAISYWLTDMFWLRLWPSSDCHLKSSTSGILVAISALGADGGLDDVQIARLLVAGEFCDLADGTILVQENQPLERLFFICSGRVRVTIASREVSHLERGTFVGEVAFLTERPATATVIAEGPVRALAFERGKLTQFFHKEAEVAGLIYQLLGRDLAHKIKVSNTLLSAGNGLA